VADVPPLINMLVFGEPGTGKTRLAGSAAVVDELSPVLFIDVEGGTLSLREVYPEVEVIRVKNFEQLGSVFEDLRKMKHGYKTVVLDSLTEIQKFGMYHIMKGVTVKDPDRDPDLPGIGEWGKNTEQMRKLVRAFRDLPMNTIFTALAATDVDKKGNKTIRPSLSGKLAAEVVGFLDIVVYYYLKEVDDIQQRLLLTTRTDEVIAKDRTDRLPPVVQDPSMDLIHQIIFGTETTP
jgi:hypothetical protein